MKMTALGLVQESFNDAGNSSLI